MMRCTSHVRSGCKHQGRIISGRAGCKIANVRVALCHAKGQSEAQPYFDARQLAASAMLAFTMYIAPVNLVLAAEGAAPASLPETVYFGNGCFWGRQKEFVDTEKMMGRAPSQITAVAGYAGGRQTGPDGKVCYYYSDPRTVYERLGHAEVVKVEIAPSEFKTFADTYFTQFKKTRSGMQRLDPQDAGPGYRNVVGLPGGISSPLFSVLKEANVNGMELREGAGNEFKGFGQPSEDDLMNVVWVVDSGNLPFHQAEQYHQFHNGIGKAFSEDYRVDLKKTATSNNRIGPTGCPELPF